MVFPSVHVSVVKAFGLGTYILTCSVYKRWKRNNILFLIEIFHSFSPLFLLFGMFSLKSLISFLSCSSSYQIYKHIFSTCVTSYRIFFLFFKTSIFDMSGPFFSRFIIYSYKRPVSHIKIWCPSLAISYHNKKNELKKKVMDWI